MLDQQDIFCGYIEEFIQLTNNSVYLTRNYSYNYKYRSKYNRNDIIT